MTDTVEQNVETKQEGVMTINQHQMEFMTQNQSLIRSQLLTKILDPRRDINTEAGYPPEIDPDQFRVLYDREGIARRVVTILPEASWITDPTIMENEDPEDTEFEKAWKDLEMEHNLYHFLHRIDELSGIGRFGVLLIGIDDGKPLSEPVDGINEEGKAVGGATHKITFLRVFDESVVTVNSTVADEKNPRFGLPLLYDIDFLDIVVEESRVRGVGVTDRLTKEQTKSQSVHWSRLLHVADGRQMSEIFGTPRMEPVYNRLYDLRKILAGSGEMFWKGAFPGYSFEIDPDTASDSTFDNEALKKTIADYSNGLQRYLALVGVSVKSLAPQVADPSKHVDTQLKALAISLGIPHRIFFGSEQAQLASSQDSKTWNGRIERRRTKYLNPMVIRPLIDRFIAFGILPGPKDMYSITWEDLNIPTEKDKAEVALIVTDALSKYVSAGVFEVIEPSTFLKLVLGFSKEEVEAIDKASLTNIRLEEDDDEEETAPPSPQGE